MLKRTVLGRVQRVLTDSGHTGKPFAQSVREALGEHVTVQVAKHSELHKFAVIAKRWVVERSFAWLDKSRRLWKNCEFTKPAQTWQPTVRQPYQV